MQKFIDIVELVQLRRIVQPDLYAWRVEILQRDLSKPMTEHMTLLLASVLWCGFTLFSEPLTFPDPKRIGTYNQVDRSRQYTRTEAPELLRSLNEAWSRIRTLEKELSKKDLEISQLRAHLKRTQIKNAALTAIITCLAFKGLEVIFHAVK